MPQLRDSKPAYFLALSRSIGKVLALCLEKVKTYTSFLLFHTVDCRWADERRLEDISILSTCIKDDLVYIPMERVMIWKINQLIDTLPVIVDLLAFISEFVLVAVFPSKNTCSSGVEQVARVVFGVARYQTCYDGLCSSHVVTCIGGVCFKGISIAWLL